MPLEVMQRVRTSNPRILSDMVAATGVNSSVQRDTHSYAVNRMHSIISPRSNTMMPTIGDYISDLGSGGAERIFLRIVMATRSYRHVVVSLSCDSRLVPALSLG